jgi:hypothetical protein
MKRINHFAALVVAMAAMTAILAPSMASAARLESSKGVLAKVGTKVGAASSYFEFESAYGRWECHKWSSEMEVAVKQSEAVYTLPIGKGTIGDCTIGSSTPVTLTEPKLGLSLTNKANTASFSVSWPALGCVFSNPAIPIWYTPGGNTVQTLGGVVIKADNPACGQLVLKAAFNLTIGGTPVILN